MEKMIKCGSCGAEFPAAQVRCPYCGTADKAAAENEYKGRVDDARRELEDNKKALGEAKRLEGLGLRAAILAVLIIGILIMLVITSVNFSDTDNDESKRRDAVKNYAEYSRIMDDYLSEGDYMEYVSFLYSHEIASIGPGTDYSKYTCVNFTALDYYECIEFMEEIIFRSTDGEYYDKLDSNIKLLCMSVNDFYATWENMRKQEKDEKYLSCINDMETELRAALKTYFDMDDDQLEEFLSLSEAQKGIRLEEVLKHE
jgi:hypothetical protein